MKGVANVRRRTWDRETYERLAIERQDRERAGLARPSSSSLQQASDDERTGEAEDPTVVKTEFGTFRRAGERADGRREPALLDGRGVELHLDAKLGKTETFEGGARRAGYHCSLCDRVYPDSSALLDHINSREHQARLGFGMRVKRSSVDDVKSKLDARRRATGEDVVAPTPHQRNAPRDSLEQRLADAEHERERERSERREKKRAKKVDITETPVGDIAPAAVDDDEVQRALGFSSFGGVAR